MWAVIAFGLGVLGLLSLAIEHLTAQYAAGLRPRFRRVAPVALAAKFLNLVAKSGGLAGLAAFRSAARKDPDERAESLTTAAYLLVTMLDPLAFAAILVVGMAALAVHGRFTAADRVALLLFAGYLALTVGTIGAATRSRAAVRELFALPRRLGHWLAVGRGRPNAAPSPSPADHRDADDLYDALVALRQAPRSLLGPTLAALSVDLVGVAQLWAVLAALGAHPHAADTVVAYAVSTLFGIVAFVPGGLGVVELSLGAILASFGIGVGVAAAAAVLYRVLEFWLPLAVGAAAAHRLAPRGRT
jgi:uncharacterized membrane protein YbhN (UPF0104 family)